MSISIIIGSTVIDFPSSAENPNWAPPIIQFAEAVSAAIAAILGPLDVPPTIMNIDAYTVASNIAITDTVTPLSFPITAFPQLGSRAAFVRYSVYRTSSTTTVTEAGEITAVYNPATTPVWELQEDRVGDANISFSIDNNGQMYFTTTTIGGVSHVGRITYTAQVLKQA